MKKGRILTIVIFVVAAGLGYYGYHVYTDADPTNLAATKVNERLGVLLMLTVLLLLTFHRWIVSRVLRFATAILVVLAILLEPILHAAGIPHPEGLWIPLLEGGAVLSALLGYWKSVKNGIDAWFRKTIRRIKGTKDEGSQTDV